MEDGKIIIVDGDSYVVSHDKIKVGETFWSPFSNMVDVYKNVDYGIFDPNKVNWCFKVTIITA